MRNILVFVAVTALGLLVATYSCGKFETPTDRYETYADAVADDAIVRGWIPRFVPQSARQIEDTHDLDTNEQWLMFSAPVADLKTTISPLPRITQDEVRRLDYPRSWFAPRPPPELGPTSADVASNVMFYSAVQQSLCVRVDWSAGKVHCWTCRRP